LKEQLKEDVFKREKKRKKHLLSKGRNTKKTPNPHRNLGGWGKGRSVKKEKRKKKEEKKGTEKEKKKTGDCKPAEKTG